MTQVYKLLLIVLVSISALSCTQNTGKVKSSEKIKPNVIVFVTDDLGIGRFKYAIENYSLEQLKNSYINTPDSILYKELEYSEKSMPFMTKMAKEGVYFTNAFATHPFCSPSRFGILSGQYQQNYGVWMGPELLWSETVMKSSTLMPKYFKDAGYNTGLIGKWHLGSSELNGGLQKSQHPVSKGFDTAFFFTSAGTRNYDPLRMFENFEAVKPIGETAELFTERAIKFIDDSEMKDEPFFLYLPYQIPHGDMSTLVAPKYFHEISSELNYEDNNLKARIATTKEGRKVNYNANILSMDRSIQNIFEHLEASGQLENTIFVFTNDQGARHGLPFPANNPYKGHKGQIEEGALRVPILFYAPGFIKKNKLRDERVMTFDILPTLLSMCNIVPENLQIDGKDLSGNFAKVDSQQVQVHDYLVWTGVENALQGRKERGYKKPNVSKLNCVWMIQDEYFCLRYEYQVGFELFEINDIERKSNLAEVMPEKVQELLTKYNGWKDRMVVKEPLKSNFKWQWDQFHSDEADRCAEAL